MVAKEGTKGSVVVGHTRVTKRERRGRGLWRSAYKGISRGSGEDREKGP